MRGDMVSEETVKPDSPAIGSSWEEVRKELFTEEEIRESEFRVAQIGKKIKGVDGV